MSTNKPREAETPGMLLGFVFVDLPGELLLQCFPPLRVFLLYSLGRLRVAQRSLPRGKNRSFEAIAGVERKRERNFPFHNRIEEQPLAATAVSFFFKTHTHF